MSQRITEAGVVRKVRVNGDPIARRKSQFEVNGVFARMPAPSSIV
jgi:hypothetical protein